jgi:hypothetical protein
VLCKRLLYHDTVLIQVLGVAFSPMAKGKLQTRLCDSAKLHTDKEFSRVLEPRFLNNESFAQIYTFTALFDDSTTIQMQFVLTNLGISDQNAACKIIMLRGSTSPLCWNEKYKRDEWNYAGGFVQLLKIKANQILIQDGKTSVSASNDKIRVTIAFDCAPDSIIPPNAALSAHGRFYEYAVLIPWSQVQGSLELPGDTPKKLTGYGMLELARSTSFPSDICRGWISFYGYNATTHFLANLCLPPGDKMPATGWVWGGSDQAPIAIANLQFESEEQKSDRNKLHVRRIVAPDSSFTIDLRTPVYRYSVVDEMGPVLRAIVKLVIGTPVTYYYEANAQLPGDTSAVPGILEFMRIE